MQERKTKNSLSSVTLPVKTETATFAMGCFWSPDALFGVWEGVIRTRVGYAGGSTENPSYRNLADHIETLQLDFNPGKVSYQELLQLFFSLHKPFHEPWKRQYMSAVFVHDQEQENLVYQNIERIESEKKKKVFTAVIPYQKWYLAEDRHQKYKLQRKPELMKEFNSYFKNFAELINSTLSARVNGFLYGYGNENQVEKALRSLPCSTADQKNLFMSIMASKEETALDNPLRK